jgi:photosystem II stability/assembly factor-like uncharacterized protein
VRRRGLLLGAGLAGLGAHADELPAVLRRPAVMTAHAQSAAMLALARAGRRIVAAGERGIVLTSDDDGRRWTQARVSVQVSLTALRFADERRGWACGHLCVLLSTDDAGSNWTLRLDGIRAAQLTLAAARDEGLHRYAQGLVDDGADKPFFDIEVGAGGTWLVGAYGLVLESSDGAGWRSAARRVPNPRRLHLYGVRSIGERMFIAGEQGLLLRAQAPGAGFEALPSPYKGSFFGLLATRSGALIAYGLRGNAFRSNDFGTSWLPVASGVPITIGAGTERADGSIVLLAQNGDLLVSRDAGCSFRHSAAAPPFPAAALVACQDRAVVLAGLRGLKRVAVA